MNNGNFATKAFTRNLPYDKELETTHSCIKARSSLELFDLVPKGGRALVVLARDSRFELRP